MRVAAGRMRRLKSGDTAEVASAQVVVDELVLSGGQCWHRACRERIAIAVGPGQLGVYAFELQLCFAEVAHSRRIIIRVLGVGAQAGD